MACYTDLAVAVDGRKVTIGKPRYFRETQDCLQLYCTDTFPSTAEMQPSEIDRRDRGDCSGEVCCCHSIAGREETALSGGKTQPQTTRRDHYLGQSLKTPHCNIQCGYAEIQFWLAFTSKLVHLLKRCIFLVYWNYFYCMCVEHIEVNQRFTDVSSFKFLPNFLSFIWDRDISNQFFPGYNTVFSDCITEYWRKKERKKKKRCLLLGWFYKTGYFPDSCRLRSDRPCSNLTLVQIWNNFIKINGIKLACKKRGSDQSVSTVVSYSSKIQSLWIIKLNLILRHLIICPRDALCFFQLLLQLRQLDVKVSKCCYFLRLALRKSVIGEIPMSVKRPITLLSLTVFPL